MSERVPVTGLERTVSALLQPATDFGFVADSGRSISLPLKSLSDAKPRGSGRTGRRG